MINNTKIQVDYTTKTKNFQLVFPINFEINIPADDSVRLLSNVLEEVDYTELYGAYSRKEKICAVSPKNLFKILVYAYMNNIYSSRQIELACKRDINFMYLLEGAKAPDHNTIARFRSTRLKNIIDNLFGQVVLLFKDYGELSCENLFVDGTKIEANANKYTFVWKKIKNNLGIEYMYPTADAGYESEENYTYFEKNGQKPCIKPANYEQTKTRKYRNDIGRAENMQYDENTDTYTCHYGRKLVNVGVRKSKTSSGYISEKTMYQCEGCGGCPHKAQCIKHNARCNTPLEERTKRFELSKVFKKQREKMLERINTEQGILLRINRSIQVEGAFGVLKEDMGFRRFLTRGTANVKTEITLLCLAYNIQKLHNKTIANRQGQFLHEIKAA